MKPFLLSISVAVCLSGCSIKPIELPQESFAYDKKSSAALHYSNAMGLYGPVDLPAGEAEKLLKERQESMIEAGVDSALVGYAVSFAFAAALGLPTSLANDLAMDTAESQFIMGAGTAEQPLPMHHDQVAFYLPYEYAKDKEAARIFAFNYFKNTMQSMEMELKEIDGELEYGVGHEFTHPLCEELKTQCRYIIRIKEPVVAYAPEAMGGYKSWVWSVASRNAPYIGVYQVANWSDLATFNMSKIKNDELRVQDVFLKPLNNQYPDWAVVYRAATYNEAPKVVVGGDILYFEHPNP